MFIGKLVKKNIPVNIFFALNSQKATWPNFGPVVKVDFVYSQHRLHFTLAQRLMGNHVLCVQEVLTHFT